MTKDEAIYELKNAAWLGTDHSRARTEEAVNMAIKALSQVSEIEKNIIKYMKKYPNHVGNMDFWEGFYACRNVVLQLDMDCRDCKEYEDCPCGKDGHESKTSQGYSIGECKDFEPQERSDKE